MKNISLTENEIWFIKCAISVKNAILPLEKDCIDEKTFKADYGISKAQAEKVIEGLRLKV